MRATLFAVCLSLHCVLPSLAASAPTQAEVMAARAAYIAQNYADAIPVLQEAAQGKDPVALNILGAAYLDGNGVAQDTGLAIANWEAAAKAGEVRALHNLGTLFLRGNVGQEINRDQARRYFQKAAALGYAPALTSLGTMSEYDDPPQLKDAAEWYRKADRAGDHNGTANLAYSYLQGRGVNEDWGWARMLYTKAAVAGNGRAYNDLAVMHQDGYGVHPDRLTAFHFFQHAVRLGYAKAGTNMAKLLTQEPLPFTAPHHTLAYCMWAINTAKPGDLDDFTARCDAIEAQLAPDPATLSRAEAFSKTLGPQS